RPRERSLRAPPCSCSARCITNGPGTDKRGEAPHGEAGACPTSPFGPSEANMGAPMNVRPRGSVPRAERVTHPGERFMRNLAFTFSLLSITAFGLAGCTVDWWTGCDYDRDCFSDEI